MEKIAVEVVYEYFSRQGYTVTSVESEKVGWDLVASHKTKGELFLEVKGLSGMNVSVELTPNEYRSMIASRCLFRLCVVVNSLVKPRLHVFSFSEKESAWLDDDENRMEIKELVAAKCLVKA